MAINLGIVKVGDEWECRCRYEDNEIPRMAGLQWDKGRKSWFTRDREKVARIRAGAGLKGYEVHSATLPDIKIPSWRGHPSLAKDGPEYPVPPDRDYFPFQKGGIAYVLARKNTLLADDMGLGKTIQAIGVMNAEPVKTALILCPAAIKDQWAAEIDEWLNYYRSVGIYKKGRFPKTDIVIINYDNLNRNAEKLRSREWDIVIADEAQNLKNPSAKRTLAVYGGGPDRLAPLKCKRFLALTGTPIDNRPIDLYPTLRYMMPEAFESWWQFTLLYCGGKFSRFGYVRGGASNMKILGALLRETCMVRRIKTHVLDQLPEKRRQIIPLEADEKAQAAASAELRAYEAATSEAFELAKAGDALGASIAQMEALEKISAARIEAALAKIPAAVEVMKTWIEGEKLVVVCYHRKVIEAVRKEFGGAALTFHGGTKDREKVKKAFIEDDSKRVFIMQVTAGGAGVDGLQKVCNHGCFLEFDWRSAVMVQAEDRLWRIGQENHVLWSYFVLPDSVDQKFLAMNGQKAWTASAILDEPAMAAEGEATPAQPRHLL